jgi:tryptophanyl-tRNA synthetase
MLEVTRELVNRFNNTYGPVLVEPSIMLPPEGACRRLPGIDGKAKMSKSLGNCIYLSDTADEVWQKVRSMYTDPTHVNLNDPGHVEGNMVFTYLDAFSTPDDFAECWPEYSGLDELKEHYCKGGLGDMKCKKFLNRVLNRTLEPMRERRREFEKDIPEVYNILKKGTESAREVAARTIDEVRHAMRIDYFNDAALIAEQAERFASKQQ